MTVCTSGIEAADPDVLIDVHDVTFEYPAVQGSRVRALESVSLRIMRGEHLAIIGPNGSGKSTLAKCLNALLIPDSGTVTVAGMSTSNPGHVWAIRQMVGMVFQNPDNQLVATTVEEDVAFGPENIGVPTQEIRQRVKEALRSVGLEGMEKRAPHRLSGGQKQRVAIAGILAMRPECIVLDEPTAMLDPVGRREVLEAVRRLNRVEGKTVVHVTHFMSEAAAADRVAVMAAGKVVMQGAPSEVFSQAERLQQIDLDAPIGARIAEELRKSGISIPLHVLTVDDLADYISANALTAHRPSANRATELSTNTATARRSDVYRH